LPAGYTPFTDQVFDEQSGGLTTASFPIVERVSPSDGSAVYGAFLAYADVESVSTAGTESSSAATTSLALTPAGGASPTYTVPNVNVPAGVTVPALPVGRYTATWTATDSNGDTSTVSTELAIGAALQGATGASGGNGADGANGVNGAPGTPGTTGPKGAKGATGASAKGLKVACRLVKGRKGRTSIACKVSYPKKKAKTRAKTSVHASLLRGGRTLAHTTVTLAGGGASFRLRGGRTLGAGRYRVKVAGAGAAAGASSTLTVLVKAAR
jgi:hypothetical protein